MTIAVTSAEHAAILDHCLRSSSRAMRTWLQQGMGTTARYARIPRRAEHLDRQNWRSRNGSGTPPTAARGWPVDISDDRRAQLALPRGGPRCGPGPDAHGARVGQHARWSPSDGRFWDRRLSPRRIVETDDERGPKPALPTDGRVRSVHHRPVAVRAVLARPVDARRHHAGPLRRQPDLVPTPADRCVGLCRWSALHL